MKTLSHNPELTLVFMVVSSRYENYRVPESDAYASIPAAQNNAAALKRLLSNEKIMGIPEENFIIIDENLPHDKILMELELIMDDRMEIVTVIFYFVGHGDALDDEHTELALCTVNSVKKILSKSSLHFSDIRRRLHRSHVQTRIYLIDSCKAGIATNALGPARKPVLLLKPHKGDYIIAASAFNEPAYGSNNRHTDFTAVLLELLEKGDGSPRPMLSLNDVFEYIQKNLKSSSPQRFDNLDKGIPFYFCNNAGFNVDRARQYMKERKFEPALQLLTELRAASGDLQYDILMEECMAGLYRLQASAGHRAYKKGEFEKAKKHFQRADQWCPGKEARKMISDCEARLKENEGLDSPPMVYIYADREVLLSGDGTILRWNASGATSIFIDQGMGMVQAVGQREIRPGVTTTYTITASNEFGTSSGQFTVYVHLRDTPNFHVNAPGVSVFVVLPDVSRPGFPDIPMRPLIVPGMPPSSYVTRHPSSARRKSPGFFRRLIWRIYHLFKSKL